MARLWTAFLDLHSSQIWIRTYAQVYRLRWQTSIVKNTEETRINASKTRTVWFTDSDRRPQRLLLWPRFWALGIQKAENRIRLDRFLVFFDVIGADEEHSSADQQHTPKETSWTHHSCFRSPRRQPARWTQSSSGDRKIMRPSLRSSSFLYCSICSRNGTESNAVADWITIKTSFVALVSRRPCWES